MPSLSLSDVVSALRTAGCVFAEDEAQLILSTARTPEEAAAMVERRVEGLPLEQVLGWADFHGLRVTVEPGVFVPRRRTEFLVSRAVALGRHARVVVDLCCGSGAVGAALAAALDGPELHAADIDAAAVRCARRNVAAYGGRVHQGDLFAALPEELRGRVDILAANVPYVPTDEVPCCRPRPATTNPWPPSTAVSTVWTSCAGSPPRRGDGWPPAGLSWWRQANAKCPVPARRSRVAVWTSDWPSRRSWAPTC
ncbi:Release factor glutamine methyltransferase [Streptomyces sp. MBT84]|nr:Release factor glutamine methyltransferase [Streptomyces sp. MBT84]